MKPKCIASIREMVLKRNSTKIRELLLNDQQIDLISKVNLSGTMTARQLANDLDLSIQNASSKLNRLYSSGYLSRKVDSAASGGIECVYQVEK